MTTLYDKWVSEGETTEAAQALLTAAGLPLHPIPKIANALRSGSTKAYHKGKLADWIVKNSAVEVPAPSAPPPAFDLIGDELVPSVAPERQALLDAKPASPFVVELKARARTLHKEHAHVHALLTKADTDESRAGLAGQILQRIVPALDTLYDRIRALQAGDTDPYPDTAAPGQENLTRKLASLRSSLSRAKGKLAKEPIPEKKQAIELQIAIYEAQIEQITEAGA